MSYRRMIEISGCKHFRLHTRNADKNLVVHPLILVKNIQNVFSNWPILGPSEEGKVQSDGWKFLIKNKKCILSVGIVGHMKANGEVMSPNRPMVTRTVYVSQNTCKAAACRLIILKDTISSQNPRQSWLM